MFRQVIGYKVTLSTVMVKDDTTKSKCIVNLCEETNESNRVCCSYSSFVCFFLFWS